MSNIEYYDDIKIIKKPLKLKIKSIIKFFLIIGTIIGCFYGATYLSSALTVGNLTSLIVYGGTSIKVQEEIKYAVILGVYDTRKEAENVALGSTIQGASGFVWEDSDKFFVIGNIYASNDDAKKVVENLKDSNYKIDIKEIKYSKLNLNFDMYDNSDMIVINNSFKIFEDVYGELYGYSISFDKGEINHLAVSSKVSALRGEVKSLIVGVQNLLNKSDSCLKILQENLIRLDELLDQTILKVIDNSSTNYSLKYAIASTERLKYETFQNLSK